MAKNARHGFNKGYEDEFPSGTRLLVGAAVVRMICRLVILHGAAGNRRKIEMNPAVVLMDPARSCRNRRCRWIDRRDAVDLAIGPGYAVIPRQDDGGTGGRAAKNGKPERQTEEELRHGKGLYTIELCVFKYLVDHTCKNEQHPHVPGLSNCFSHKIFLFGW